MRKKTKRKVQHHAERNRNTYSKAEIALASTQHPMPAAWRAEHVGNMRRGLEGLRSAPVATECHWRLVADALNIMQGMEELGWLEDTDGNLPAVEKALGEAGARHMAGKPLRLDGTGLAACEALIDAYEDVLALISEKNVMAAIVHTEERVRSILRAARSNAQ